MRQYGNPWTTFLREESMKTQIDSNNLQTVNRITRDISDGLVLIGTDGAVLYVNPSAIRILGSETLREGGTLSGSLLAASGENDMFHQYILDSIYEKNVSHSGTVTFTRPDGSLRYLSINTSYAFSDDGLEKYGVILQFSDITELHEEKIKREDTIKVLVALLAVTAIWNYVYMVWEAAGQPVSDIVLTAAIEAVGVIGTFFALRYTSITWEDFGLGTAHLKQSLIFDAILTLAIIAVMILAKLLMQRFLPNVISPDGPLFYWNAIGARDLVYILTVVLQEFLTRGVVQGSLDRILPAHYPPAISIVISSLFFGAIHLHKGLVFMLGAAVLLSFFGVIYRKQKTIWGLCIPHLFLSWSLRVIWGM